MSERVPLSVDYDPVHEVLTVKGGPWSGAIFWEYASAGPEKFGECFRLKKDVSGQIAIDTIDFSRLGVAEDGE